VPSSRPPPILPGSTPVYVRIAQGVGLLVLLLGALAVIVLLPRMSSVESNAESQPTVVSPSATVTPPVGGSESDRQAAGRARDRALQLQAQLENEGATVWGVVPPGTSYTDALAAMTEAAKAYDEQRFQHAEQSYRDAEAIMEHIEASRPERLKGFLASGEDAMAQYDHAGAIRFYELALTLDPVHEEAQAGLARAHNLPQVLDFFAQGRAHESEGDLKAARQMYEKAASLDADFEPAHTHRERIASLILERDYQRAVSAVLLALEQGRIEDAKSYLAEIKAMRPDQPHGADDLEAQIRSTERRIELEHLRVEGLRLERVEEWESAIEVYARALALDDRANFALVGADRSQSALELNEQVDRYLLNPETLGAPEHRAQAREIRAVALADDADWPKLDEKVAELGRLIELYSTPVPVQLVSNGLTDIRIHRVKTLGRFTRLSVHLLPGAYRAQGSRMGYRDVIVEFVVNCGDQATEAVTIECEEEL